MFHLELNRFPFIMNIRRLCIYSGYQNIPDFLSDVFLMRDEQKAIQSLVDRGTQERVDNCLIFMLPQKRSALFKVNSQPHFLGAHQPTTSRGRASELNIRTARRS